MVERWRLAYEEEKRRRMEGPLGEGWRNLERLGLYRPLPSENLNELGIPTDGPLDPECSVEAWPDTGASADGLVLVYFEGLAEHLIEQVRKSEVVLGCVAWLTHEAVLSALAEKTDVAIVVQKEDFLRPDMDPKPGWKADLRRSYDRLRCSLCRYHFQGILGCLSTLHDSEIQPIRCMGHHNAERSATCPRMHHKFLLLCRSGSVESDDFPFRSEPEPYAVWTGSFNVTRNAQNSLENAVLISDPTIVRLYYAQWQRVESLSEPLDWETEWASPEWRIGT